LDEAEKAGSIMRRLIHRELTHEIIGSFFKVYNAFGYGFLEAPYVNALTLELQNRGLGVQRELPIELHYEGRKVGLYRADLIVEQKVRDRSCRFLIIRLIRVERTSPSLAKDQIRIGCARVRG
jgi:hypothetical protein